MAFVLYDRIRTTTTTTGTGTLTLGTAWPAFLPASTVGDGNTSTWLITDYADNWEVFIGTYTLSGNTLSRDTVLSSSNSNNPVNFGAGFKEVRLTMPASYLLDLTDGGSTTLHTHAYAPNAFSTVAVSGQSDVVADAIADTLTLVGSGVTITTDATTDTITFTVSGVATDTFKTISVSGQSDVVADSPIDTLTLAAGSGIAITTNATTDTITIATTIIDQNILAGKIFG